MHELTIRIAALDDVAAMAELRDASGWQGGAGAEIMRRYLSGEHHPQHALAQRVMFVAESAGSMAGYIAGHRTTRFGCEGELQWLLVAPAYRGGAAAARLLAELATWFATQGVSRVCVNVAPENEAARRFYARHGAVALSEHWMLWSDVAVAAKAADVTFRARGA